MQTIIIFFFLSRAGLIYMHDSVFDVLSFFSLSINFGALLSSSQVEQSNEYDYLFLFFLSILVPSMPVP